MELKGGAGPRYRRRRGLIGWGAGSAIAAVVAYVAWRRWRQFIEKRAAERDEQARGGTASSSNGDIASVRRDAWLKWHQSVGSERAVAEPSTSAKEGGSKTFAAFISHFKMEAAMEARFLQVVQASRNLAGRLATTSLP